MRRHARRIVKVGTMLAVVTIWVVLLRPQSLGGPAMYIVVRGTSMLPTYQNGDLVVVQSAPAYVTGDAIAYRVPAGEIGEGHVIVHRITGGNGADGFAVQGDNNDAIDPWMPRTTDIAGKSWVAVPGVGRVIAVIHQPVVAGGLAAGVMVALILAGPSRPRTHLVLRGRTDRASTLRNGRRRHSRPLTRSTRSHDGAAAPSGSRQPRSGLGDPGNPGPRPA